MEFFITQVHTPKTCPKEEGGMKILYNENAEGIRLKAIYAIHAAHTIHYVLEADSYKAISQFLAPGMLRCAATISPFGSAPVKD